MKEERQNKMAIAPMDKLFWKMGLPMIVSMVLQALYNVVDSIFVANMKTTGALANQALTYAFPIQNKLCLNRALFGKFDWIPSHRKSQLPQ